MNMVFTLLGKLIAAFVLLYLLFWAIWFFVHSDALYYLLFSKDKKWKATPDNSAHFLAASRTAQNKKTKRVVFVRHGESTWNQVFNGSPLPHKLIPRLVTSAIQEMKLLLGGTGDSYFYDAPLSKKGIDQALGVRTFLNNPGSSSDTLQILRGFDQKTSCLVVSSNLRRAISTALLGFWDRLNEREESLVVLPCLQEITYNSDAIAVAPPRTSPPLSWIEATMSDPDMARAYRSKLDMSLHTGSKAVDSNGIKRIMEFNQWLFNTDAEVVVVVGHSLWFKSYFKEFLPRSDDSTKWKKDKLPNCGVVEFVVEAMTIENEIEKRPAYYIQPQSVNALKV